MLDIIGDIHGHCNSLERLLQKMGYSYDGDCWKHPDRKVLFFGDYIDRGPQIPETLQLVQEMEANGQAIALMGNHELNAILLNEEKADGGTVRPRTPKNIKQHKATMDQFEARENGEEKLSNENLVHVEYE